MGFKSRAALGKSFSFLGHSLPRLLNREVKMMTSKLSCLFDVCDISNVVVSPLSRHHNEGGRHESTNILLGLPVDLNGMT